MPCSLYNNVDINNLHSPLLVAGARAVYIFCVELSLNKDTYTQESGVEVELSKPKIPAPALQITLPSQDSKKNRLSLASFYIIFLDKFLLFRFHVSSAFSSFLVYFFSRTFSLFFRFFFVGLIAFSLFLSLYCDILSSKSHGSIKYLH